MQKIIKENKILRQHSNFRPISCSQNSVFLTPHHKSTIYLQDNYFQWGEINKIFNINTHTKKIINKPTPKTQSFTSHKIPNSQTPKLPHPQNPQFSKIQNSTSRKPITHQLTNKHQLQTKRRRTSTSPLLHQLVNQNSDSDRVNSLRRYE